MKNEKIIFYLIALAFVLVLIVLLQRLRNCENRKQEVQDFLNGDTSVNPPSANEILNSNKECKFWSFN